MMAQVDTLDNIANMDLAVHECRLSDWHDMREQTRDHHTMLVDLKDETSWIATDTLAEVTR